MCLIGLFLWDRLRYDRVALLALLAAVATGVVPSDKAFNGFANPVLPLIGAALIVSVANTLVMGLGGYRFGDYWKLGLPLSLMVVGSACH